jgi:hypothetical protein
LQWWKRRPLCQNSTWTFTFSVIPLIRLIAVKVYMEEYLWRFVCAHFASHRAIGRHHVAHISFKKYLENYWIYATELYCPIALNLKLI